MKIQLTKSTLIEGRPCLAGEVVVVTESMGKALIIRGRATLAAEGTEPVAESEETVADGKPLTAEGDASPVDELRTAKKPAKGGKGK